jgi:hypothetical protein
MHPLYKVFDYWKYLEACIIFIIIITFFAIFPQLTQRI